GKVASPQLTPRPVTPIEPTPTADGGTEADQAATVESSAQPTASVPRPSVRDGLTADLQHEVEAALGDMSIDALVDNATLAEAADEIALESQVEGRVVSIRRDDVFLELGGRNQGVAPLKQFDTPPEPGTVVRVVVNRLNTEDGLYEVSIPGFAVDVGDWSQVSEGLVVEATVTGHNKGGLECTVGSLRGFIPLSQISIYRVEDLQPLVGEKFSCVVTEANRRRKNLVLSRRSILEREKEEDRRKLWEELEVGQLRDGTVRSLQNFGAFVDLGGVDGLIHISQLGWDRVGHPSEVVQLGQKVQVRINKLDRAKGRVSLGFRDLTENPWSHVADKYTAKSRVRGTVTKIMDFGALVKLEPGVSGLIHISELSHQRVWRVSDAVEEGQEVECMILSVDPKAQRIGLSLKALEARPVKEKDSRDQAADARAAGDSATRRRPAKRQDHLKGGLGQGAGGERFGLKW
ncbi:MAG: 30S ribosomal protein S1, partial [Pirellulales bacterium]